VRDTKGEAVSLRRQRQPFAVPPGPPGANGAGMKTLPDGDLVYDYWNTTSTLGMWGPGGSCTYCQAFATQPGARTLSEFWIALSSNPFEAMAYASLSTFTNEQYGSVVWNSTLLSITAGANKITVNHKVEGSGQYLFCVSNFTDSGSSETGWLTTDLVGSAFNDYANNDPFWSDDFTAYDATFTFYARFGPAGDGHPTCASCTNAGDVWCLDDDVCYSTRPASCHNFVTLPSLCPLNCQTQPNCTACTDHSGACIWCLDQSTAGCFPKGTDSALCNADQISSPKYCPAD